MSDRPFTLLGINSDGLSRSALKAKFEKEGVAWPQIIESRQREISKEWNVSVFPTLYVLDHEGVIRLKGVRDEHEIMRTVEELLAEVPDAEQEPR